METLKHAAAALQPTNMMAEDMIPDTWTRCTTRNFGASPGCTKQRLPTAATEGAIPFKGRKDVDDAGSQVMTASLARHAVKPRLQVTLQKYCMPTLPAGRSSEKMEDGDTDTGGSVSSSSSVTASSWQELPATACCYAIWRGGIVYGDREEAKTVFMAALMAGVKPKILSTADYDEAQAFCDGIYWIED
ncbi:hypothetical protein B0H17DRAFT_1216398 [Mycena rosella]|uniref:Uncharacterized protein n=1 Tax=Mycena rosella TaxID=1033263 RepID=A0AAD7C976_MYCRO|nr:hypothetical protein B0H17DRAFT_1216398 [Mycena rosella]